MRSKFLLFCFNKFIVLVMFFNVLMFKLELILFKMFILFFIMVNCKISFCFFSLSENFSLTLRVKKFGFMFNVFNLGVRYL